GCHLLNWTPQKATAVQARPSLLPVLVVLFLVSYGLLSLLVVEQGRTIDSQRNLILSLFSDSTQLSQLKNKAAQKQRGAKAQAQAEAKDRSQAQAPSSQDHPRAGAKNESSAGKLRKPLPKPPKPSEDFADERRTAVSI